MATKSIGVLTAFLNADATGLMKTFNQVDRRLARASASFTQPGAKLALGFIGVENALKAVSNSVRNVVQNIETIPGVPAETVASIITLRDSLASAKNWIDQMTAGIVGFGAQFTQAIGVGAAGLMGYDDASGLSRQETPDEIARAKDSGFDAKIASARKKLAEASKAAALATQTEAQQIVALRAEAERYETFAAGSARNTVERLEAQTAAQEKLKDANAKMAALNKQLADSEQEVKKAMTGAYTATLSRTEAITALENKSSSIFHSFANTSADKNDPGAVARRIALNNELAETQRTLGKLYEKNAQISKYLGETIADGFTDAIFSGKSFSDVLKNIAAEIAATIVKQMILNAVMGMMGGGAGGGIMGFIGGFFADGGRPPVGRASVVGERGPELFVPDSAGMIIPNHRIGRGSSGGSGGGGDTFNFSPQIQSGVTRQELAGIMPAMFDQFVAKVADKNLRGGAFRRAMG